MTSALKQEWIRSGVPEAERHDALRAVGDALASKMAPVLPPHWKFSHDVTVLGEPHHLRLELQGEENGQIKNVNIRTDFDFDRRRVWLDNMAITNHRGEGVGRIVFRELLDQAGAMGFHSLALKSFDIGSYFWITQDVKPDQPAGLIAKMDSRLDEIARWTPAHVPAAARALLGELKQAPDRIKEVAALDFRDELRAAFASAAYQEEMQRLETEGWSQPGDERAAEIRIIADSIKPKEPRLGHLLLINSGWRGGMEIPKPGTMR